MQFNRANGSTPDQGGAAFEKMSRSAADPLDKPTVVVPAISQTAQWLIPLGSVECQQNLFALPERGAWRGIVVEPRQRTLNLNELAPRIGPFAKPVGIDEARRVGIRISQDSLEKGHGRPPEKGV
jgi:hypothetical protein